jgi:radical SAM family protein
MRATIATSPIHDFYFTPRRDAGLGARVLARELRQCGLQTRVRLLSSEGKPKVVPLPAELGYLRPFLVPEETGPVSWFTGYRRFGPDPANAAKQLLEDQPDLLFLSCWAWGYSDDVIALAREVHRLDAGLPIIVGGHGPSVHPDTFLAPVDERSGLPLFRLVAGGEAEGNVGFLLDALGGPNRFVDLRISNVPSGARHVEPVAGAPPGKTGVGRLSVMLTRGCPCACDFCANFITSGRAFRTSPVESWMPCLEHAIDRFGLRGSSIHINIEDDNILYLKDEFLEFISEVRSRHGRVRFSAENGLDYRLMDPGDVDRLKESGFVELNLSLGAASTDGTRHSDRARLAAILRRAASVGIPVTTHFICGLPTDRIGDIADTLTFLGELPTQIGISNFYPVPGLPGFQDPEVFRDRPPRLALGSSVYPWTGSIDTASMITAFRLSRWLNLRRRLLDGKRTTDIEQELAREIARTGKLCTVVKKDGVMQVRAVPHLNDELVRAVVS